MREMGGCSMVGPAQTVPWRAVILRGVLIACMVLPWFDVNYYFGSSGVSLFNISEVFSQASSLGGQWLSISGGSSSVPSDLAFVGMLAFLAGLVPIVRLAVEIYHCVVKRESPSIVGPLTVIIVALAGGVIMATINMGLSDMLSTSFGGSMSVEILSLGLGWWLALIIAGVCMVFDRKDRASGEVSESGSEPKPAPAKQDEHLSIEPPEQKRKGPSGSNEQEQRILQSMLQLEAREPAAYEELGRALYPQLKDSEVAGRFSDEFAKVTSLVQAQEAMQQRLERLRKPAEPPAGVTCPRCQSIIKPGFKFCGGCSLSVNKLDLPAGWIVCPACGALAWEASGTCPSCKHQVS